jgi:drug/metabolite transporter superfamily protein YnfA
LIEGAEIKSLEMQELTVKRLHVAEVTVNESLKLPGSDVNRGISSRRAQLKVKSSNKRLKEEFMSRASRMLGGILLVVLPTVMFGGLTLLSALTRNMPGYVDNPMRHDLWRAGHAHAGVYLVLSLVMLRYVDEAVLSPLWKWVARTGAPVAAILIPAAFFLSVASPTATQPNGLMNLAYVGALFLAAAVLSLGVGLIRAARRIER